MAYQKSPRVEPDDPGCYWRMKWTREITRWRNRDNHGQMDPTVSLIIYIYGVYGYKYLIPHLEIPSSALPLSSLSWIDPVYHRLALCNASSYILFILSFIIYYLLLWLLEENGVPIHTACNKQIHALTLSESHQFPNRKHPARRSLGLPPIGIYSRCQISAFLLTAHPVIVPLGLTRVVTDHLGAVS